MEEMPNPAEAGAATQEQFAIQNVYIKDISFETPNSPNIFMEEWKPQMEFEISNNINPLDKQFYEVVLNITATVKVADKTAFLIEVHQAGIFTLKGFDENQLSYMLNSYCPNILFPFARETIYSIVTRGGFQPPLLAPINFDALYEQHLQQNSDNHRDGPLSVNS